MLTFNLKRTKALLVKELYQGFLPTVKIASVIIFVVFAVDLIFRISNQKDFGSDYQGTNIIKYSVILMIGGFAYASYAFREFSKLPTRAEYLAMPGSSLEKLVVKWLFTNPIYILLVSLMILILSSILTPIVEQWVGHPYQNEIFNSREYWTLTGVFFITHSIFLFGSIAFNRLSLIKTLVALILIALCIGVVNAIWFRIVWSDMFETLFRVKEISNGNLEFGVNYHNPDEMWQVKFWKFAFKYLLAPVLWVASLFKLSEKEV